MSAWPQGFGGGWEAGDAVMFVRDSRVVRWERPFHWLHTEQMTVGLIAIATLQGVHRLLYFPSSRDGG